MKNPFEDEKSDGFWKSVITIIFVLAVASLVCGFINDCTYIGTYYDGQGGGSCYK